MSTHQTKEHTVPGSTRYALYAGTVVEGIVANEVCHQLTRTHHSAEPADHELEAAALAIVGLHRTMTGLVHELVILPGGFVQDPRVRTILMDLRELALENPGPMSWDEADAEWAEPLEAAGRELARLAEQIEEAR